MDVLWGIWYGGKQVLHFFHLEVAKRKHMFLKMLKNKEANVTKAITAHSLNNNLDGQQHNLASALATTTCTLFYYSASIAHAGTTDNNHVFITAKRQSCNWQCKVFLFLHVCTHFSRYFIWLCWMRM